MARGEETLVATDLGIAILTADLTLYGFVIAYYAFSRSLHEQEKSRIFARLDATLEQNRLSLETANALWLNFYGRAALVDIFLVLCTCIAAISVIFALSVIGGLDLLPSIEVGLLGVLFVVVALWVGAVGSFNFLQNLREFGDSSGLPKAFWTRFKALCRAALPKR